MKPPHAIAGRNYVMVEFPNGGPKVKALVIGKVIRAGRTTFHLLISQIKAGKEIGTEKLEGIDPGLIHPIG